MCPPDPRSGLEMQIPVRKDHHQTENQAALNRMKQTTAMRGNNDIPPMYR